MPKDAAVSRARPERTLDLDPERAKTVDRPHYAIVDIGSNSVRLVVYDQLGRAPLPRFNEKSLLRLGEGLAETGVIPADSFRRAVQAAGGKYQVVKNTIAELAGSGTPAEGVLKNLKGTNSIAYTATDAVALAKALTKIAKDVPSFKFKAGVVEGKVISIVEIQQLANLPSKEELISKIMFLLNAPAQRIATALNALPRNMAVTVNEAIKANKFGPATGEAAPEAGQ